MGRVGAWSPLLWRHRQDADETKPRQRPADCSCEVLGDESAAAEMPLKSLFDSCSGVHLPLLQEAGDTSKIQEILLCPIMHQV